MATPRETPKIELTLRLPCDAVPSRVLMAAKMLAAAVDAAGGEAGTTLVVSNRYLKASIRGWDADGAACVTRVVDVVKDPLGAVQERPELKPVALAFADTAPELLRLGGAFLLRGVHRPLKRLDQDFVATMRAAGQQHTRAARTVRGTTDVFSPVLRAGRGREGGPMQVRIVIAGTPADVELRAEAVDAAFEAAKARTQNRIQLAAEWTADTSGRLVIDPKKCAVLSITALAPIAGAELVRVLGAGLSRTTADEILSHFESDS